MLSKGREDRYQVYLHQPSGVQALDCSLSFPGSDAIHERTGFCALLNADGPKTILVENASRFARDLAVQLAGQQLLKELR